MSSLNVLVNGLPLPPALIGAIHTGRWVVPTAHDRLQAAFPNEPIVQPSFFNLDGMQRENKGWLDETNEFYLGKKDDNLQPGDIDPTQSVVIADLGPDRLIALDYRVSNERPRVVYLTGNEEPRWVEAAPDIESLLLALGL